REWFALDRRRGREPRADLARLDLGEHGKLVHPLEVALGPRESRFPVLPERHDSSGGSGRPSVSYELRSHSIATGSKRKYERGGSGPQVFDEYRSSGYTRGTWSCSSCSMSQ